MFEAAAPPGLRILHASYPAFRHPVRADRGPASRWARIYRPGEWGSQHGQRANLNSSSRSCFSTAFQVQREPSISRSNASAAANRRYYCGSGLLPLRQNSLLWVRALRSPDVTCAARESEGSRGKSAEKCTNEIASSSGRHRLYSSSTFALARSFLSSAVRSCSVFLIARSLRSASFA